MRAVGEPNAQVVPHLYLKPGFPETQLLCPLSNQNHFIIHSSTTISRHVVGLSTLILSSRLNTHSTISSISGPTMSESSSVVYSSPRQQSFDFDSNPAMAMTSYARSMHLHTKKQMDQACRSSRRRSSASEETPSLSKTSTSGSERS
jgi:hypothetical protein